MYRYRLSSATKRDAAKRQKTDAKIAAREAARAADLEIARAYSDDKSRGVIPGRRRALRDP